MASKKHQPPAELREHPGDGIAREGFDIALDPETGTASGEAFLEGPGNLLPPLPEAAALDPETGVVDLAPAPVAGISPSGKVPDHIARIAFDAPAPSPSASRPGTDEIRELAVQMVKGPAAQSQDDPDAPPEGCFWAKVGPHSNVQWDGRYYERGARVLVDARVHKEADWDALVKSGAMARIVEPEPR